MITLADDSDLNFAIQQYDTLKLTLFGEWTGCVYALCVCVCSQSRSG
jgi:hypothetical protein